MWRKVTMAGFLAILMILIITTLAMADTSQSVSPATVAMQGQAIVFSNGQTSELRIKTNSADSSGWLLEVSLDPVSLRSSNTQTQVWNVSGTFILGTPQSPQTTGTAAGWVDSTGTGDVKLSGGSNIVSLDMPFTIASDGTVASTVQGQWPMVPVVQSQPTSVPAQPTNHFFWYLSRSAAMAAYLMLFVSLALGIGLKTRYLDQLLKRWRAADLHQFTALLATALIALHIFSLLGDSYLKFNLQGLLLPGASPYRPTWDSFGVIGFYMLLILTFSCYVRRFIGLTAWRFIHYFSFAMFFIIIIHGIKSGTDITASWTQWLYLLSGTSLVFLLLGRFLGSRTNHGNLTPVNVVKIQLTD
jgi:sulfoxide reductase heme-binding subunit YedZ